MRTLPSRPVWIPELATVLVAAVAAAGCDLIFPYHARSLVDAGAAHEGQLPADGRTMDSPAPDGPVELDGPGPDQQPADGGVVPGTWVPIKSGTFTMGSPNTEPCTRSNEDQRSVTLTRDFELQSTEVTQEQFARMMSYNPAYHAPGGLGASCGGDCPVELVNWSEAAAYCNALSAAEGKTPCYVCSGSGASVTCQESKTHGGQAIYSCPGYRLPTEAEWEYAYRAGTQTPYYSGASEAMQCATCDFTDPNADAIGWYCANSSNATHPGGQKQANARGLLDMAGNVWEWCHDRYEASVGSSPATDPWGSLTASDRAARGGSWSNTANIVRAAARGGWPASHRAATIGFRCAKTR